MERDTKTARFTSRLGALILDLQLFFIFNLIVVLIFSIFLSLILSLFNLTTYGVRSTGWGIVASIMPILFAFYFYFVFPTVKYSRTLGKKILGIEVLHHKTLEPIGILRTCFRFLIAIISFLIASFLISLAIIFIVKLLIEGAGIDGIQLLIQNTKKIFYSSAFSSVIIFFITSHIINIISFLLTLFLLFIPCLLNKRHRSIHDIISGTVVIYDYKRKSKFWKYFIILTLVYAIPTAGFITYVSIKHSKYKSTKELEKAAEEEEFPTTKIKLESFLSEPPLLSDKKLAAYSGPFTIDVIGVQDEEIYLRVYTSNKGKPIVIKDIELEINKSIYQIDEGLVEGRKNEFLNDAEGLDDITDGYNKYNQNHLAKSNFFTIFSNEIELSYNINTYYKSHHDFEESIKIEDIIKIVGKLKVDVATEVRKETIFFEKENKIKKIETPDYDEFEAILTTPTELKILQGVSDYNNGGNDAIFIPKGEDGLPLVIKKESIGDRHNKYYFSKIYKTEKPIKSVDIIYATESEKVELPFEIKSSKLNNAKQENKKLGNEELNNTKSISNVRTSLSEKYTNQKFQISEVDVSKFIKTSVQNTNDSKTLASTNFNQFTIDITEITEQGGGSIGYYENDEYKKRKTADYKISGLIYPSSIDMHAALSLRGYGSLYIEKVYNHNGDNIVLGFDQIDLDTMSQFSFWDVISLSENSKLQDINTIEGYLNTYVIRNVDITTIYLDETGQTEEITPFEDMETTYKVSLISPTEIQVDLSETKAFFDLQGEHGQSLPFYIKSIKRKEWSYSATLNTEIPIKSIQLLDTSEFKEVELPFKIEIGKHTKKNTDKLSQQKSNSQFEKNLK